MKDKEKQIEEMAKDLKEIETDVGHILVNETFSYVKEQKKYNPKKDFFKAHTKTFEELTAEEMFKKGYRKIDKDNSVVLSREEYQLWNVLKKTWASDDKEVSAEDMLETLKNTKGLGSKETAEKFAKTFVINLLNNSVIDECTLEELEFDGIEIRNALNDTLKQLGVEIKE